MSHLPTYGEVPGRPVGEMSRRTFMRRVLWVGTGLLSIEFLAGTVNFLWPNVRGGLGGKLTIGTAADVLSNEPGWSTGIPCWPRSTAGYRAIMPEKFANWRPK